MAGFFGLFNYEKEGPGIPKNAPKKKTFVVFFETFFRNFWKFITINLVYNILCIPVFTNGVAAVGITHVTRNIARDKHSFGLSDFFDTVKKNWKQGLLAGIFNTLVYLVLLFDTYFFFMNSTGIISSIGVGISLCILFVFSCMNYYIWTMIITFKLTLKQVYKNSFRFVFINMKMNMLCILVLLICYAAFVAIIFLLPYPIVWTLAILIALLTFPSFRFLLIQFCTFPAIKKYIIDPYYAEHPEEDIEKRQDLGIEVELPKSKTASDGETEEEPENVFED